MIVPVACAVVDYYVAYFEWLAAIFRCTFKVFMMLLLKLVFHSVEIFLVQFETGHFHSVFTVFWGR